MITSNSRSCRMCRFNKCVQLGMSSENSKVGRKSTITKQNLFKSSQKRAFVQEPEPESSYSPEIAVTDSYTDESCASWCPTAKRPRTSDESPAFTGSYDYSSNYNYSLAAYQAKQWVDELLFNSAPSSRSAYHHCQQNHQQTFIGANTFDYNQLDLLQTQQWTV